MSKSWGLAGLRIGYAAGPARIIHWLRAAGGPYSVSGPSLALAMEWLQSGGDHVREYVKRIRMERTALAGTLRALGAGRPIRKPISSSHALRTPNPSGGPSPNRASPCGDFRAYAGIGGCVCESLAPAMSAISPASRPPSTKSPHWRTARHDPPDRSTGTHHQGIEHPGATGARRRRNPRSPPESVFSIIC